MQADDLGAFRAAHPSTRAAIEACTRPEWALQLAFEEATDRNAVIRSATLFTRSLLPTRQGLLRFLDPRPTRLEIVEHWTGASPGSVSTKTNVDFKSLGLSGVVVSLVMTLARALFLRSWIRERVVHQLIFFAVAIVAIYVVAGVLKRLLMRALDRQTKDLDEHLALAMVLDEVVDARTTYPASLPQALGRLRFTLGQLLS